VDGRQADRRKLFRMSFALFWVVVGCVLVAPHALRAAANCAFGLYRLVS